MNGERGVGNRNMTITEEIIPKIESVFGFPLYEWQRDYLLGKRDADVSSRRNGKTFAYCVKLLLSNGEPIKKREIFKYADGWHGNRYPKWFAHYCLEINEKLISNGFKTRIVE